MNVVITNLQEVITTKMDGRIPDRGATQAQATAAPALDEFGRLRFTASRLSPTSTATVRRASCSGRGSAPNPPLHQHDRRWRSDFIRPQPLAGFVDRKVRWSLAYLIVGLCSLPGPRAGTATLIISRAPFGLRGNSIPTAFSWAATLGWETVNIIIIGTFAIKTLLEQAGIPTPHWMLAPFLVIMAILTFAIPVLGHATLVVAQKWLSGIRRQHLRW